MKNGTLTANEVAQAVERGREIMAANGAPVGNTNAAGKHHVNGIELEKNLNAPHDPEKGIYSWHGGKEHKFGGAPQGKEISIHPEWSYSGKHTGRWHAEVKNKDGTTSTSGTRLSFDSAKETAASMHSKIHGKA